MGRSKVGTRPNEFKYAMALYGAAWPEGDHYYVCGGGGMGLVPRVVWAQYRNGRCSDQVGEFKLGSETPMRMLMCPWGSSLLLGNANGGLRRLQISSEDARSSLPRLTEVTAAFHECLSGMRDEVGCMGFSSGGGLLGVGFKESGLVAVIAYPSMRPLLEWRLEHKDPEVKDLDFCPTALLQQQQPAQPPALQPLGGELVATVGGDGACLLWRLAQQQAELVAKLEPPAGLPKPRFVRCRFARAGAAPVLFTLVNAGRDASYLAAYGPTSGAAGSSGGGGGDNVGSSSSSHAGWSLLKKVRARDQPASAMDISRSGEWIAAGFADGALRVFAADTLLLRAEAEASIAFVSSVTFSGDGHAVLAVGGDANCYVHELAPRGRGRGWLSNLLLLLLAIAVLLLAAAVLHLHGHPEDLPYHMLERLAAATRGGQLEQACSASGPGGAVLAPLRAPVCDWARRAAAVLPPDVLLPGGSRGHDEL